MDLKEILKALSQYFKAYGFSVFAVGGTVRDYLLNKDIKDLDFATDARYEDMKEFLEIINEKYKNFGSIQIKFLSHKIDITTFRKESAYLDRRHPSKIEFAKTMNEDYTRRDFTINGLYLDESGRVYDYTGGQTDLKNKIIRTIGDAKTRITEDPLRIIRAIRFKKTLNFTLSDDLVTAIRDNLHLLELISKEKLKEECHKMKTTEEELKDYINTFIGGLDY